ncbi:compound eye opsin BCRH1-like [Oratosquilla oratoria]|uniref:compound eye opsin BCRH1-like n=1 Tax=Oratosquilla oratoria TaxID=337810 RepID=UPI003F76EB1A
MSSSNAMFNGTGPRAMAYGAHDFSFGYPEGVTVVDIVPDSIRHMVHDHWSNYPPVNPMWHYLLGVIYIFLFIFSVTGNCLVMHLIMKNKSLKTPANMLVFNLAFSDFGMQVTQFPPYIHNCFHGGVWMFSPFFCELYACLGAIFGLCSLWTLAFISFDRYNVIVNGVSSAPLTKGRAFLYILFCYAYAIGWSLPPFFGWGAYVPEGILDSCSFDYLSRDVNRRSYGLCIFTFDFVIPLTIIVCSYVFIVKAIFAHEKAMREQAKKMNVSTLRSNADSNAQSAEVRIAKVAMTNVALWIICWTPYAAVVLRGLAFDQSGLTPLVSMLPALLAKTASVYNPMIYAINHPKFRLALQKTLPWFCIHEPEEKSTDNQSNATKVEAKEEAT